MGQVRKITPEDQKRADDDRRMRHINDIIEDLVLIDARVKELMSINAVTYDRDTYKMVFNAAVQMYCASKVARAENRLARW